MKPWDRVYTVGTNLHRPAGTAKVTCCGIEVPGATQMPASLAYGDPCRDDACFGPDDLMAVADAVMPPCLDDAERYVTLAVLRSRR